ncbi:6-bladed beta-propeller [Algoriphagus formosus]|nr:6-bladed beta-propeller [Algoriphagus aquimaris]
MKTNITITSQVCKSRMVMGLVSSISVFLFLSFLSCHSTSEPSNNSSTISIIPFEEAKTMLHADIVERQEFVLLSTAQNALFSRIDKLLAMNDQFYLFDHLSKAGILVFDRAGNFIRSIGEIGEGPQQLKYIDDFQVLANGDVLLLDKIQKQIITYDSTGQFKEKVFIPINSGGFAKKEENWFLSINFDHQNPDLVNNEKFGVFNQNFEPDSLYFSYPKDARNANVYYNSGIVSIGLGSIVYHRPPNDTLAIFNEEGKLIDRILIDFGSYRLPDEVVFDFQKIEEFQQKEQAFRYLQTPILPIKNNLFGLISGTDRTFWTFVINRHDKELYVQEIDFNDFHLRELIIPSANLDNRAIVSLIDPVIFRQDSKPEAYPLDVQNHLKREGTVLLLQFLKP